MSILDVPRYSFTGIFYTNPCTANNDDVLPEVVVRDTNTLGPSVAGIGTDDQIRTYLRTTAIRNDYGEDDCKLFINSGWNPFGNHWCNFLGATISSGVSAVSPAGRTVVPPSDPIIGLPIKLLGSKRENGIPEGDPVMVDMDPTGLVTTQIFLGGIQIGDPNNGGVAIYYDAQCYQSWLNFCSTVSGPGYGGEQNFVGIGCMMQFVIPSYIIPAPTPNMPPSLQDLLTRAKVGLGGLVVRFRIYEVEPGYTDVYLKPILDNNQREANNAYGYVTGTVGIYNFNEPYYEPEGRKLEATYPRPQMAWASPDGSVTGTVPGAPLAWQGPPALIGNAVCIVKPGVISIDLSSSFPKYGYRNPNGPVLNQPPEGFDAPMVRADVGDLALAYIPAGGGSPVWIGDVDYGLGNFPAFRAYGCIQDMTYDPALYQAIQAGQLVLIAKPTAGRPNQGLTLVTETIKRLMVEPRTTYVGTVGSAALVGFRLRERGGPPTTSTVVYIKEYMNIIETQTVQPCVMPSRPNQSTDIRTSNRFSFPPQITLANQTGYTAPVYIQANAIAAGVSMLNFQLDDTVRGPSVPAWSTCNYATLRVYTDDDYSALIAAGPLQWDVVYHEVLRYYYVLFPAMSQYVKLNDRCAVYGARQQIRQMMCTPDQMMPFRRTQNMPVTRTLSPGKIGLLLLWLDQEEADPNSPCKTST